MHDLNTLNYLNLVGYIVNTVVTFAIGGVGVGNFPTNAEVSHKYQTLVTPADWAFSIWGSIFLLEGVFAIAQMLPKFRADALVQKGVKNYFFIACIAQALWTLAFCSQKIAISVVVMAIVLASLVMTVISQNNVTLKETLTEYWLLRFPFVLHCGWIVGAMVLNVNAALVARNASVTQQVTGAVLSLISIVAIGLYFLYAVKKPAYSLALVLAWATIGITMELRSPKLTIVTIFSQKTITRIMQASATATACLVIATLGRASCEPQVKKKTKKAVKETEAHID